MTDRILACNAPGVRPADYELADRADLCAEPRTPAVTSFGHLGGTILLETRWAGQAVRSGKGRQSETATCNAGPPRINLTRGRDYGRGCRDDGDDDVKRRRSAPFEAATVANNCRGFRELPDRGQRHAVAEASAAPVAEHEGQVGKHLPTTYLAKFDKGLNGGDGSPKGHFLANSSNNLPIISRKLLLPRTSRSSFAIFSSASWPTCRRSISAISRIGSLGIAMKHPPGDQRLTNRRSGFPKFGEICCSTWSAGEGSS
jgi:hypothetical protein